MKTEEQKVQEALDKFYVDFDTDPGKAFSDLLKIICESSEILDDQFISDKCYQKIIDGAIDIDYEYFPSDMLNDIKEYASRTDQFEICILINKILKERNNDND